MCVCPWYAPLATDAGCVPCPSNQVYNNFTKQCQGCPAGTTISPDSTACLCAGVYQKFSFVSNACECPFNMPVLGVNGQCSACYGYYDGQSRQCLECPVGSNKIKNSQTNLC